MNNRFNNDEPFITQAPKSRHRLDLGQETFLGEAFMAAIQDRFVANPHLVRLESQSFFAPLTGKTYDHSDLEHYRYVDLKDRPAVRIIGRLMAAKHIAHRGYRIVLPILELDDAREWAGESLRLPLRDRGDSVQSHIYVDLLDAMPQELLFIPH